MTPSEDYVKRLPNDIGGAPAERIRYNDHELQPKGGHAKPFQDATECQAQFSSSDG